MGESGGDGEPNGGENVRSPIDFRVILPGFQRPKFEGPVSIFFCGNTWGRPPKFRGLKNGGKTCTSIGWKRNERNERNENLSELHSIFLHFLASLFEEPIPRIEASAPRI